LAKAVDIQSEAFIIRSFADRLILRELSDLQAVMKLSDIVERLTEHGLGLAAVRSLLASDQTKFAYADRRWVPAARLEGLGRPLHEAARLLVDRFGGPMPIELLARDLAISRTADFAIIEDQLRRIGDLDLTFITTENDELALSEWGFLATDETLDRAYALNGVDSDSVAALDTKLKGIDWRRPDAVAEAVRKVAPVHLKDLGAVAWLHLCPQDQHAQMLFNAREFLIRAFAIPGFIYGADGLLAPESMAKQWIEKTINLADRLTPEIEIEDAQPIEVKPEDVDRMVQKVLSSGDDSVTAVSLLEQFYEITPTVKTFPDDLENVINSLRADPKVWWVGGDRFRTPDSAPEIIYGVPEPFAFVPSDVQDEEGELVDVELTDEGLSTSLRRLLIHPLATDVLDEDIQPALKSLPDQLRLVLKGIHRELGTFPLCQVPTGYLSMEPKIQEMVVINPEGEAITVWVNTEARLMFGLLDWFFDQPVESGAVFSLAKRPNRPNVFDFRWEEQTDPVVFITTQRMEELRVLQEQSEAKSTLQLLQEVMGHWPKGADFLTILWELNVVRRTSRRLVASLLSSYVCFYQRSGSPVWHFDAKKVEQGFDKTKKKFIRK